MTFAQQKSQVAREAKIRFGQDNKLVGFEDQCLYCFAGANQIKKNIGALVDAFQTLANPRSSLILALKSVSCQVGSYQFTGEYELREFVHNPNVLIINNPLSDDSMAEIYRMSDFLLYPSQGEAPGLQVSEAQLCGAIPICTNYTGLPEESCFPEFLLRNFTFLRGQFGCYRAVVGEQELADMMDIGFDFWRGLRGENQVRGPGFTQAAYEARYNEFMTAVEAKFAPRTWENTAKQLSDIFRALQAGGMRVDLDLATV